MNRLLKSLWRKQTRRREPCISIHLVPLSSMLPDVASFLTLSWRCHLRRIIRYTTSKSNVRCVSRTSSYVLAHTRAKLHLLLTQKRLKRKEYITSEEFANEVELVFSTPSNSTRIIAKYGRTLAPSGLVSLLLCHNTRTCHRTTSASSCLICHRRTPGMRKRQVKSS